MTRRSGSETTQEDLNGEDNDLITCGDSFILLIILYTQSVYEKLEPNDL